MEVLASSTKVSPDGAAGRQTEIHSSTAKAWMRALALTAPIARQPERILPTVIEELAERLGEAPALLSDSEALSYRGLAQRANRYAHWALTQGLTLGDAVGLLMPNRPDYLAIWLGITRVGAVVALLNTNLTGPALAQCINLARPKYLIVAAELMEALASALPDLAAAPQIWVHGSGRDDYPRIDREIERHGAERLHATNRRPVAIEDRALYIYTSGTTGRPKAANVSHGRLMQWSHWFAGLLDTQARDRMYNCLPLYHSVGGVLATGAVLVGGGSVVVREKFSARDFWPDVVRWDCTLFQYIGELCRYLLHTAPSPQETAHRVRLCCGNGLQTDVWTEFKRRFRIPQIVEFYAATEGTVSLFNLEGRPGSIGRIPAFLAHRAPVALAKFDVATGAPVRNSQGRGVRCDPNEVGEALGQLVTDAASVGVRFEGYTDPAASDQKIWRDVFEAGDAWVRTGDLMRRDTQGYFYFVDRIGDTFRWKGENVAASEVAEAIAAFPGIAAATVYGVTIPGTDGRAGMAAIVSAVGLDLTGLRTHLRQRLPGYARPMFLRLRHELEMTATFKLTKTELVQQGYDPAASADVIYFDDPERQAFVRLDKTLYDRLQTGQIRL